MVQQDEAPTQQAGWINDARGRRVSQLDPVMMHLLRRPGILPPEVLEEITRQVDVGITRGTRVLLWSSVVGLVCLGIALTVGMTGILGGNIDAGRFFKSLLPYLGVVSGSVTCWIALRSARHQQIGRAMLKHLRCPHCGYDIRSLPADPADGATVCPECGCAWQLEGDAQ